MIDVTTVRIRNIHALARNSLPSLEGPNGRTLTPPTQTLIASLLNKLKKRFYTIINIFMIFIVHILIFEFPVSTDSSSVGPGYIPLTYFNNA